MLGMGVISFDYEYSLLSSEIDYNVCQTVKCVYPKMYSNNYTGNYIPTKLLITHLYTIQCKISTEDSGAIYYTCEQKGIVDV